MRTPITIITGYLGAGKTTLLQKIAKTTGMKIAILMNEFGEISIDSRIIEGKNIKMAELSGGCVCCSLSGEFDAAIAEMIERVKPQWIVVETTGVAEPAALAFDVVENIAGVRLDSIVTVVDSFSMVKFPSIGHTGREQIELADLLVINKSDLISEESMEHVKNTLKEINNRAANIECTKCEFDTSIIFGIERNRPIERHGRHKMEFQYFDFRTGRKLNHDRFLSAIQALPKEIYRSKGFVVTEKGSFLMNYVGGRWSMEEFECQRTELVFIGKNIEKTRAIVTASLEGCVGRV